MKKTTTQQIIWFIPYVLLYCLYVLLTLKERKYYYTELEYGSKVKHIEEGIFTEKVYLDRSKKPKRNYMSFEEFWTQKGYL